MDDPYDLQGLRNGVRCGALIQQSRGKGLLIKAYRNYYATVFVCMNPVQVL